MTSRRTGKSTHSLHPETKTQHSHRCDETKQPFAHNVLTDVRTPPLHAQEFEARRSAILAKKTTLAFDTIGANKQPPKTTLQQCLHQICTVPIRIHSTRCKVFFFSRTLPQAQCEVNITSAPKKGAWKSLKGQYAFDFTPLFFYCQH